MNTVDTERGRVHIFTQTNCKHCYGRGYELWRTKVKADFDKEDECEQIPCRCTKLRRAGEDDELDSHAATEQYVNKVTESLKGITQNDEDSITTL